jgi:hypothetical protein
VKSPWYRVRKGLFLHGRDLAASCSAECRMRAFIQTRCFGPWDTVIESRLHYHKLACSGPYDIPKLPAATHPCTEYWTPSNGIGPGRQYYSVRNTSFPTGEHAAIHYTRQQDLFCRLPIVYVKSPQDLRTLYAPYSQPAYLFLEIRRRKKHKPSTETTGRSGGVKGISISAVTTSQWELGHDHPPMCTVRNARMK